MPPKSLTYKRVLSLLQNDGPFICASCRHSQTFHTSYGSAKAQLFQSRRRQQFGKKVSTIASVTAVNAQRDIPLTFRPLHDSLSALEHEAAIYVNLSQLKLALRGLESENAVTRVAVTGLRGRAGACTLVRALLADPLAPEPAWEKQVADNDDGDGKALLLRYGEQLDYDQRHPLVKTLSVPSSTLLNHNLEIIIQSLTPSEVAENRTVDEYVVPLLEVPNSASGRVSTMTYPVHKALVYGDGFKDLGAFAPITRERKQGKEAPMVAGAINGDWTAPSKTLDSKKTVNPVNVHLAERAIGIFRLSLKDSIEYEKMWFDSGLPAILVWLLDGTSAESFTLKPSIRRLTEIILANAEEAIIREEQEKTSQIVSATVPTSTRETLDFAIQTWAESAHTELRDQLDTAFDSKSWRKTAWWKLFWRVDDVGMIATDVLQRFWLVEAEKELLWLVGRVHQAGLLGLPPTTTSTKPKANNNPKYGTLPPSDHTSDLLPPTSHLSTTSDDTPIPISTTGTPAPYPRTLSLARSVLSTTTAPLTSTAQRLLLTTLSTTALTSTLSALLYTSLIETSTYEAGGIAALGFVWSMRRLQKRWEETRAMWVAEVREEGRNLLRELKGELRMVVREGGVGGVEGASSEGWEERKRAKGAVEGVRRILLEME